MRLFSLTSFWIDDYRECFAGEVRESLFSCFMLDSHYEIESFRVLAVEIAELA
jgi:hypothetical protein